jgi:2,3-bisphosphoglycerate-dependent phosphoglycerate mutase
MTVERVYLIRHGQTAWNVDGRWQGFEPVPLNDVGLAQARTLAGYLRAPISAIYSSDLPRAVQTAEALGQTRNLNPIIDIRLREFNLGIFQGHTNDEINVRFPEESTAFHADYMGYLIPGGESRFQLQARAFEAWVDITANALGPEIAVVSHGGTIKMLLLKLFAEQTDLRQAHIENTSVTTIERDGDGWRLVEVAHAAHLTAMPADGDSY